MCRVGLAFLLALGTIDLGSCTTTTGYGGWVSTKPFGNRFSGSTSDWRYQTSTSDSKCGIRTYHSSSGTLSSPNYPGVYPNNENCEWVINPGTYVYLKVTDLHLESCCDHLQIYDEHGNEMNASSIDFLYGDHFRIVFTSDGRRSFSGFQIHWSRDYPTYPMRTSGNTNSYNEMSSANPFGSGSSGYNGMTTPNPSISGSSVAPYPCGTSSYSAGGVIESPNYPFGYYNNLHCEYHLKTSTISLVRVDALELEKSHDYLQITYTDIWGNHRSQSLTGTNRGFSMVGRDFNITFSTDGSVTKRGFQLSWRLDTSHFGLMTTNNYNFYYAHTTPDYWKTTPRYTWWGYTTDWWKQTTNMFGRYVTDSSDRISVNCNARDLNVAVPRDIIRQVFPGVSEYDLTLNDPNCKGQVYSDVVIFRSSILGCGMTREDTGYDVVYSNRISPNSFTYPSTTHDYGVTTNAGAAISRFDSPDIKVECHLKNYATAVGFYRPQHNHELVARGYGNFTVYMDFYRDYNYNYKITSYPISLSLNEDVFVDLRLDTADPNLKIAAQSCYAKSSPSPYVYYDNHYTFIRNGCPNDRTVSFESSSNQHVHFRFRSFEFLKNKDQVYIFCEVNVCNDTDYYNRCHRNCNFRQRRGTAEDKAHDLRIFQGPLKLRDERSADAQPAEESPTDNTVVGSAVLMSVCSAAVVISAVVLVILRRNRNPPGSADENRVII